MITRTIITLHAVLICFSPIMIHASTPGPGIYEKNLPGTMFELKNPGKVCPANLVDRLEKGLDDRYFKQFFHKHSVNIITEINKLHTTGCCGMAIRLSSVKKDQYDDIVRYLDRAFDRYPPGFIKQYLRNVVITGRITSRGHEIGGYAKLGSNMVFLSAGRQGISQLGPIFHHEFNHVLYGYANQIYAAEAFAMAVERGFRYGKGGLVAILSGNGGCRPSEDWFEKGFACNYGTSAIEEDYATLAAYALSDWDDFSRRALKHQRIVRKFMGLMQFYNSFDPRMDEYFWMGKSNYRTGEARGNNVSPLFFLDDRTISDQRGRPIYKISDLLTKEPSLNYAEEIKKKTRRIGYNNSTPVVINDTVNLYRITLIPPGEKENRISMVVVPGMRMKFPLHDHQHVSNYWAIAVQEVSLQPFRHIIEQSEQREKGSAEEERIFFIEDVLDRERDRKYRRRNVPVRTIYLSTVQNKSGNGTFSAAQLRNRAGENWENPFGFLIINDTLQTYNVRVYLFKKKGKLHRSFRLAPNSREVPGLVNSMDAIGISRD